MVSPSRGLSGRRKREAQAFFPFSLRLRQCLSLLGFQLPLFPHVPAPSQPPVTNPAPTGDSGSYPPVMPTAPLGPCSLSGSNNFLMGLISVLAHHLLFHFEVFLLKRISCNISLLLDYLESLCFPDWTLTDPGSLYFSEKSSISFEFSTLLAYIWKVIGILFN